MRLSYSFRPCSTASTIVAKSSSVRIIRPAFLATSVPLPIAIPMWAALIDGASLTPSPVIATTSPFCLSVSTSNTLCSGATRPTTPMLSIRFIRSASLERRELRAEDRLAVDPQLLGDRRAGHDVVTGDHANPDVRALGILDRLLGRRARWVDHPDEARHLKPVDVAQQIAGRGRTSPGRCHGHRPPSRAARPLPSAATCPSVSALQLGRPTGCSRRPKRRSRRGSSPPALPLDEAANDFIARRVGRLRERGHQLVGRVERKRRQPLVALVGSRRCPDRPCSASTSRAPSVGSPTTFRRRASRRWRRCTAGSRHRSCPTSRRRDGPCPSSS